MTSEKKGMLAATVAYCIFGFSYLFAKLALSVEGVEPMILLCARNTVSFIVLNLLVLTRIFKINFRGKNIWPAVCLGLLQPLIFSTLENYGVKFSTTSFTGLIASLAPVFSAILGVFLLREKPNWKQWLCIALSIAGVMMVSLGGGNDGQNTVIGCVCLILAYLVAALYSILSRKLSKGFTSVELTYVMFTVGFIGFTSMAFITYRAATVAMLVNAFSNRTFLISSLYLGILSAIVAYVLINYAISQLPVSRATIFSSFTTIISVLAGIIIMKDPFTWVSGVAFVLILFGVYGVNQFARKSE